jgi:hypothetical protein
MKQHPCSTHESDLSAYLDGELPAARVVALDRHLQACRPCTKALGRLRSVSALLRRWDAEETRSAHSPAFRSRVMDRLDARDDARPSVSRPHLPASAAGPASRPATGWRERRVEWFAAAAVVLATVALGAAWSADLGPAPDAHLTARLDDLQQQMDALRVADIPKAQPLNGLANGPRSVSAWEPVVSKGLPTSAALLDDATHIPGASDPEWERHGGLLLQPSALTDFQRFESDRLSLSVEQMRNEQSERGTAAAANSTGSVTAAAAPAAPLERFLGELSVRPGAYEAYRDVQVWPVVMPATAASQGSAPLTSRAAIRNRTLRARESEVAGMEGMIVVENRDPTQAVLLLSGDVFRGGRQDRVVADDVLVPPGRTLHVRTKMSGNKRKRGRATFADAPGVAPSGLRALLAARAGQYRFDQGVRDTLGGLAQQNRYASLERLYRSNQLSNETSKYLKRFSTRLADPDVVGFAVAVGSELLGVEVFGDRATFESLHGRALQSYVLEALARDRVLGSAPPTEEVRALLAAGLRGVVPHETSSGLGSIGVIEDVETGAFGYGLRDVGGVVHAVLFPRRPSGTPAPGHRPRRGSGPLLGGSGSDLESGRAPPAAGPEAGGDLPTGPSLEER